MRERTDSDLAGAREGDVHLGLLTLRVAIGFSAAMNVREFKPIGFPEHRPLQATGSSVFAILLQPRSRVG